jgi:cytochrome c oxidase assembly protein subunit 15
MRDRYTVTPERFATVSKVALFLLVLIVFTGAAVRLTGSGLGCPTWPKCTATSVHSSLNTHGVIEFGNRVLTFFVSLGVIAAALGAYRVQPERRDLRYLALSLPLGVVVQAVIGGISVRAGLAPGWVMAHYVVSMLLLVWAFDLWWRSERRPEAVDAQRADRTMVLTVRALMGLAVVAIVLGTVSTAAGPHAGSSGTGEFVGRLHFLGADTLRQVIHVHGYIVTALGLGTLAAWWRSRRTDNTELTQTFMQTLALLAAQGVIGILQYQLQLPSEMVWVHVALATLTWVGYVHLRAAAGPLPARATKAAAVPAPSS